MGGAPASEPPSVPLSFANNFWGKDDAGVGPMLDRMHAAKITSDELKNFYATRAAIEEEYARKLLNLSRKPLGTYETGTLRLSIDVVRAEIESQGKAHQSLAQQMKTELEEPLVAFAGGMKERRKIVQNGIEKLLKLKMQQTSTVNKARDRYEQDCLKIKGFLAQAHMVMGHEERKNKARLEKTQINLTSTSSDYEAAIKVLEETTTRWNRDWKAACDSFQDFEEERINFTRDNLFLFTNIAAEVCVSDSDSFEKMRVSLDDCDMEKDIISFVKESGTGQERPGPPKFIDFCRGDAETSSQASEDENYSVAQFARTMNPAYRASSPAPSAFESHHDPNNPLAREMGLQSNTRPIVQDQISVKPRNAVESRRSAQPSQPQRNSQPDPRMNQPRRDSQLDSHTMPPQRAVQPDPRLIQAQEQARQQYQHNQVPHHDYPTDGMTQFCRIGAPSDRNALPSPVRPASRDSQSDCSNTNSFSSIEPPSGSASPGKPLTQLSFPEPSPIDELSSQKKRGFFNSPFARRKSKPEIEPPMISPPSTRSTWAPSPRRTNDENVSPTRPAAREVHSSILQDAARSMSPELVDPRANFQLNVGNNVFDVASPDKMKEDQGQKSPDEELDPIAQALEELKGVTKQTSLRVSADRYHGLATPQPPGTPSIGANLPGGAPTPLTSANLNAAKRGTPPPSYEQPPMSLLGAPKPAHTSRQMQKTTQMYVSQRVSLFNGNANGNESVRSSSRSPTKQDAPRATSPAPTRAASPRPSLYTGAKVSSPNSYRGTPQVQPQSPSTYQSVQRQALPQSQQPKQPQQPKQAQQSSQRSQPPLQSQTQAQPQMKPLLQPQIKPEAQAQTKPQPQLQPKPLQPPQQAKKPEQTQPKPQQTQQAQKPQQVPKQQIPTQQAPPANSYRAPTVTNPYASSNASTRARAQTASKPAQTYGTPVSRNSYTSTRGSSPSINTMPRASSPQPPQPAFASPRPQSRTAPSSRAASPQPQFRQSHDRPSSSRGSDMALQLAPVENERSEGSVYGGSQRGRGSARPQSAYYSGGGGSDLGYNGGGGSSVRAESRVRSKSLAEPKNYNSQGRMILNYSRAMYPYSAQIPEELGFQKGDILAVLRLQDDGWWEAEAVGKNEPPGLVPSNYLQPC